MVEITANPDHIWQLPPGFSTVWVVRFPEPSVFNHLGVRGFKTQLVGFLSYCPKSSEWLPSLVAVRVTLSWSIR